MSRQHERLRYLRAALTERPVLAKVCARIAEMSPIFHVADDVANLSRFAQEVGGVIDTAGTFVFRHLRVGAQRPRAHNAAGRVAFYFVFRGDDLTGLNACLTPTLQRAEHVVLWV